MSRSFTLTTTASNDVLEIWNYIAEDDSERGADRLVAQIYDECEKLGSMPGLGHYREELLDKHYRFWSVWSYLIVYRWETSPIQVIAIIHGARDLEAFFARRSPPNT